MDGKPKTIMKEEFKLDIPATVSKAAFYGVSFDPDGRGERARADYADTLESDLNQFMEEAAKAGTVDLVASEFARYREGYRKRTYAYLNSSARCVSSFIAGPSNFPAARMNKRSEIAHKRLGELLEFRAKARAAIFRALRPDLAPIYSGDANALERLQMDITKAETVQARMKVANALIRKHWKAGKQTVIAHLMLAGFDQTTAGDLVTPDCFGGYGFPSFRMTNNGANIRRMKQRFAQITKLRQTPASEAVGSNARFEDCPSENRVRLWFDGKPAEAVRNDLKAHGFRWTPSLGCWQGYRTAIAQAKRIAGILAPDLTEGER